MVYPKHVPVSARQLACGYPEDFPVELPGELLERELLSIEHTVNSIGDDTAEDSEAFAAVLKEELIKRFGISDITVTFDPCANQSRTVLVFADLDEDEDADLYEADYAAHERVNAEIADAVFASRNEPEAVI